MPPKKARSLPHDKNTLLHPPEDRKSPTPLNPVLRGPHFFSIFGNVMIPVLANQKCSDEVLVRRCKVQEVVFDAFSVNVIRLKIPIPNKPGSDSVGTQKFITRMKDTDFFQVLSMYLLPFLSPSLGKVSTCQFRQHLILPFL